MLGLVVYWRLMTRWFDADWFAVIVVWIAYALSRWFAGVMILALVERLLAK